MEFKREGTLKFKEDDRFSDEFLRFVTDETGRFFKEKNEAASAKIDGAAITLLEKNIEKIRNEKNRRKASVKELSKQEKKIDTLLKQGINENGDLASIEEIKLLQEKKEQLKTEKNQRRKEERKSGRRLNARLSLSKALQGKRDLTNELYGNKEVSGDAFTDGTRGLVGTVIKHFNPLYYMKGWIAKILAAIAPTLIFYLSIILIVFVLVIFIMDCLFSFQNVGEAIQGFFSITSIHTTSMRNTEFDDEEIEEILEDMDLSSDKEDLIEFLYRRVGYPYSQEHRASGYAYDCSSLAYYAWKKAGVDISYGSGYPPTAAEGARMLEKDGKCVPLNMFSLEPGDLIYYGGHNNGRYKGIYHVAVYVGDGIVIEALNARYGVVYQNLRTSNIVMVCRPG